MKVFIVENNDLLVGAIMRIIEQHTQLTNLVVTGYAASCSEALHTISTTLPDIVILDLSLNECPDGTRSPHHGLALLRDLRHLPCVPRVLIYSYWNQPYYLWTAWQHGALGFLDKDTSASEFATALTTVMKAGYAFSLEQLRIIQQRMVLPELTPREYEILALLAQGRSKDDIAEILRIAAGTVRTHTRNLFDKFDAHSQGELISVARRLGFVLDKDVAGR